MGYYHTRLLSRMSFLDSIVETDEQRAKEVSQKFETPWFTNIENMVEERSPDGIVIAVPTKDHVRVALKVAQQIPELKAILIEKPIATSVKDALELKSKLAKYDIKTIIGHIEVFNPVVNRIQEILHQKIIGEPRTALFQRRGAVGEERVELLGEVYEDVGVHDFDVALRIFPHQRIKIFAAAVKLNGVDNSSSIIFFSEDSKFHATFLMSREYAGKLRMIDIEGTQATLRANLITQIVELRSLEIARGEKDMSAIRIPFSSGEQTKVYGEPLLLEMWNLIDCIQGKTQPLVSVDDGINALKFVEAARMSIKLGKVITLQLD
jgi:UDP-N-acetylglucosamine 3-dehydrogenase